MKLFSSIISTMIIGLTMFSFPSCEHANNNKRDSVENFDTSKPKLISQTPTKSNTDIDTLTVDKTCAVIVSADSLQIEKRVRELGEDFYIGADDYAFYLNETYTFLDSMRLKTIECNGKKFLKFIYADKKQELINLTNMDELWKVYFFEPTRRSKSVDMTMINEEYKNYFK